MRFFRKKHGVKVVVDKDLHVYLFINSEDVEKSTVVSPSGSKFKGNRVVRISEKPKENCFCGVYRIEITSNGKTKSFNHTLRGPDLKVRDVVPLWSRYEGISAFYVLSEAKYDLENHGDMPFFFMEKDFKLPTGYVTVPEFLILPNEIKKITFYTYGCDRVAMKQTEEYEEVLRRIGRKLEEMGRARFGLATSAL